MFGKRISRRCIAAALLVPAVVVALLAAPAQAQTQAAPQDAPPFAPGQILVGVQVGAGDARDAQAASGADLVAALSARAGLHAAVLETFDPGAPDDGLITHVVQVPPGRELDAAHALEEFGGVAYAELNWQAWAAEENAPAAADDLITTPLRAAVEQGFPVNDPLYAGNQWYLQRISMSRAWRTAYAAEAAGGFGGNFAPVVVAVIDSGVDANHPDLAGRVLSGVSYVSGVDARLDDCSHGTHIAGLIGAGLNDAVGIAGAAPTVQIEPYKVLYQYLDQYGRPQCGGTVDDIAQAIRDAAQSGIDVINMSLQYYNVSSPVQQAVEFAASKGVLMIASAGNDKGNVVAYPAAHSQVIAVAALDESDSRAFYSNYGPEIDVAAPGGSAARRMLSTWSNAASSGIACQVVSGGKYCTSIGTSQAAGVVSGVVALLRALAPDASAETVRAALLDGATPLGLDPQVVGRGKVNAYATSRLLLPANLRASISQSLFVLPVSSPQRITTVRLDNPSLDPLIWEATLPSLSWVRLNNSSNGVLTGLTVADQPDFLTLTISPTALGPGVYATQLALVGTRADGSQVQHQVLVQVSVGLNHAFFLPLVAGGGGAGASSATAFAWEAPAYTDDRTVYDIGSGSGANVVASLPANFAFPLRGRPYSSLRIYGDGLIVFPLGEAAPALPNNCLPSDHLPQEAVYGWWADLDPGAGGQVSTFPLPGRFVVEFAHVPSGGAQGVYDVSFQIVLYATGDVRLNYRDVPQFGGPPAPITVGVEGGGGLFYNQLFCAADGRVFGAVPEARTSHLIEAEDIF